MKIYTIKNNYTDKDLNSLKATFIYSGRIMKNNMDDSKNDSSISFTCTILNDEIFLDSRSRLSFGCDILPEWNTLFIKDNGGLSVESKSFLRAEQDNPAGLLIFNQAERRSKK